MLFTLRRFTNVPRKRLRVNFATMRPSKGVVGYLGALEDLKLKINHDEVAQVFTVPLETLANREIAKRQFFRIGDYPGKFDYEMPVYCTEPRVWGFTAIQTNIILSILIPDHVDLMNIRGLSFPNK